MRFKNETYADLCDQAEVFRAEARRHEPGTRERVRLLRMATLRENEMMRRDRVVAEMSAAAQAELDKAAGAKAQKPMTTKRWTYGKFVQAWGDPAYGQPWTIALYQQGKDRFTVVYGKQVTSDLDYARAATELGAAFMHDLAGHGLIEGT